MQTMHSKKKEMKESNFAILLITLLGCCCCRHYSFVRVLDWSPLLLFPLLPEVQAFATTTLTQHQQGRRRYRRASALKAHDDDNGTSSNSSNNSGTTTTTTTASTTMHTNINFEDWLADAPHEVNEWTPLPNVEGSIPKYLVNSGTLIRNGGGMWSSSGSSSTAKDDDEQYSHIFDGLAKISAYRITSASAPDNSGSSKTTADDEQKDAVVVSHCTQFIRSTWYDKMMIQQQQQRQQKEKGSSAVKLPPSISTGPIILARTHKPQTGTLRLVQAIFNSLKFDNTPVNIWDFGSPMEDSSSGSSSNNNVVCALTDAPPRSILSLDNLQTQSTQTAAPFPQGAQGYEMLLTAHPEYAKGEQQLASSSGSKITYNIAVELGLQGPRINLVQELSNGERRVVGRSSPINDGSGVPYSHSFGLSDKHAIVVLQPLRLDLSNLSKILELGFLRAMTTVPQTRIIVFDLASGDCVVETAVDEPVYFYHSISTAEVDDGQHHEISVRLCAYKVPDIITGEDQYMRLERCRQGKQWRNRIPKGGTFCDVVCDLKSGRARVEWNEQIKQGFELPTTRYSRAYGPDALTNKHPRYVYAFGAYACGFEEYDSFGLFKYDLEENCVSAFYRQDSIYPSEPIFVTDPNGTLEDDGVILSQIYDGNRRETALLILDATTMEKVALAWTGQRSPMDFHGTWISHRG